MPARSKATSIDPSSYPCLCAATRRVDRLLNRIYDEAMRPLGITILQKSLLTNIGRAPDGIDTATLSDRLALDRSTLTRNLDTLHAAGLVQTEVDPADRRRRIVRLTDHGAATLAASEPLWRDAQTRVVAALGPEQARALADLLASVESTMRDLDEC